MKIIKRDGTEAPFHTDKIIAALDAANADVAPEERAPEE